jgi:hypothetical protein
MNSCKRCKHKRCKTWTIKIKIMMTMRVTSNWNQKGRKGRQQSTWGLQPRGSWTTASTRDVRWPPPRPRLVVDTIKREKAWSAWTSSNSTQKLYQPHHDHLISTERKHAQNFGRHNQRRTQQLPRTSSKIRVSLSLAPITVYWKNRYILNHVHWNQRWTFLCPFLFIIMMHSIFVTRVTVFGHWSLNICSCMSKMMFMHCWCFWHPQH